MPLSDHWNRTDWVWGSCSDQSGEGFRPQTETEEQSYLRTWYVVQNSALGFFLSRKKTVTRTSSKSVTGNNSSSSINNVCTIVLHPGASTGNIFTFLNVLKEKQSSQIRVWFQRSWYRSRALYKQWSNINNCTLFFPDNTDGRLSPGGDRAVSHLTYKHAQLHWNINRTI